MDKKPLKYMGFPHGSAGKESTCNVGNLGSILGLGRSPGEEKGYPLQYSGLEYSMDCISNVYTNTSWNHSTHTTLKHTIVTSHLQIIYVFLLTHFPPISKSWKSSLTHLMGNYHILILLWHYCCVCLFYLRLGSEKILPRLPTYLAIFASRFENQLFI